MTIRRDDQWVGSSTRAQSAVLGLILLIGMAATVSVGIFLVAGETLTSIEHETEEERVESAMVELSQELTTTTGNSLASSRSIDLDVGQDGAVVWNESGWINITSDGLEEGAFESPLYFGTIEYESDDGTKLAYEAGAVFRETGNETQLVSAPQIHYNHVTDTLSLPVITTTGDEHLHSGDVTFRQNNTEAFQDVNVVENESVTLTIQSDYYRGWETFFEREAGDTSVREVDHENRSVEVMVGYLDIENAYEDGILVSENFDDFDNADVDNGSVNEGSMPELDDVIDEMVEEEEEDAAEVSSTDTVKSADTYWTDEELVVNDTDTLEFDLSDGNSTLIVDENITVSGELIADADGTDHELKIYTTGHFDVDGGNVSVVDGNASNLQLYGTSETHVGIGPGESSYTGTIYASRDEFWGDKDNEVFHQGQCQEQVCMQSNVDFEGALIASSTNVHSASVNFEYDESLEDNDIDLYPDQYSLPPQLTYLNVAHHEIEVKNS